MAKKPTARRRMTEDEAHDHIGRLDDLLGGQLPPWMAKAMFHELTTTGQVLINMPYQHPHRRI